MRQNISVKLFTITSLFFFFFIIAFILFQSLAFESFYEARKTRSFNEKFHQMYDRYLEEGVATVTGKTPDYLKEFEESNNARAAIASIRQGKISLSMLSPDPMNRIYVNPDAKAGILMKKQFILPVPGESVGELSDTRVLALAFREFVTESKLNGNSSLPESVVIKSEKIAGGTRYIIVAELLPEAAGAGTYLISVTSLQPVGEAASVVRDLYIYFSIFAVLLVLLLSYVFSNMVSKPLVSINRIAMKMAALDFSERCDESKKDEIGSLAHTLNFLSDNLNKALSSLKIANSRLTRDIEKERQLEKMRKEFVAGVSHELKTPISLIMGYAEGLKENLTDGADRERYIGVILDETQKMGDLVNDMLDLSQLESGKFKLNMEEFNLNELMKYVMRKFKPCFSQKNIAAELTLPQEDILVNADEFRIEQVVCNFLNNAIRHTSENGSIRLNVNVITKGIRKVRVEVENEGPAIEKDDLEKIWHKFYKVEKSRKRDMGGTGLGLSIVRNILSLHGAEHGVVNTLTGVCFYFELDIPIDLLPAGDRG